MSSWTSQLLSGFAEHLATSGIGTWHQDGSPYGSTDTGIVIGAMPAQPERVILLNAYPMGESLSTATVAVGLQVRTRAGTDPRQVWDLDDTIWEQLHGATQLNLGEVTVIQVYRTSSASLGQGRDGQNRWERTSNYHVDALRPTSERPD